MNIIREISLKVCSTVGVHVSGLAYSVYVYLHLCFMALVAGVTLFSTNLFHLSILFMIVSMDALSVVVLHGCPLTALEKATCSTDLNETRCCITKSMGIFYSCEHEYEKTIDLMVNVWLLVAFKMLVIIALRTLNVKILDFSCIYKNIV